MQKSEVKILIVEDDAVFGATLKEALQRDGWTVFHAPKPDDALSLVKVHAFSLAIVDCMLPKMNGRELCKKLEEEVGGHLIQLLMSGIFRDKNFVKESLAKTGAKGFLTKPFDMAELLKQVNQAIGHLVDVPISPALELMTKSMITPGERIKAINSSETVNGFDLPWFFSILMHPKISGVLNIVNAEGDPATVGFKNSEIVQVANKDQKSYFGVLLVEHGFISQEELDNATSEAGSAKKLGERLVDSNMLSPHAISIVMAEQQGIRLGRIVSNTSVKVNFVETQDLREEASIDVPMLNDIFNDWVSSKFPVDWIKTFYTPWIRYKVVKGPEYSESNRTLSSPAVLRGSKILNLIAKGLTVETLQAEAGLNDSEFFTAFHNLLLGGCVRLGEEVKTTDLQVQRRRFKKLEADLARQNHFERLGVSPRAKEIEIKRSYHELAKTVHPDRMTEDVPMDLRDLARKCFNMIQEAHEVLSNQASRDNYVLELEQGRAEKILAAEQLMEQARSCLTKGDIRRAKEILDNAVATVPMNTELKILLMWSMIKSMAGEKNPDVLNQVRDELSSIPPEDRHNAIYFYVKGLFLRESGDYENARRSFEQAIAIEPNFIDAKRDLNVLSIQISKSSDKPVDLLRGDLKDVLGALLGGKKKKVS